LRRGSPQASRSPHCRAGRPILSPLIPGCSVASGSFRAPGPGARCSGGIPNVSSPHRGRDLPRRALGKMDSGGRWLRVHLERPRRTASAPSGARASRGEWRSPCSDTLVWACSSAEMSVLLGRMPIHQPEYSLMVSVWTAGFLDGHRVASLILLIGNRSPIPYPACDAASSRLPSAGAPLRNSNCFALALDRSGYALILCRVPVA
jgi:hypothetical protein